ncbi:beta-ketoacyl-ACP synthase III [Oscillatoria salina]|uniref:beta-ketoacyl-ACP synthase III n=1 Tax=Oscillatoria salina TaxID=331517 RepID=UPI0013BDD912|nr:beta-ketoacyl-ACP synthase III [Oscillatoria salina]MBZ8182502.1 beta-ketoacyl-ACP synthase III [Oscillatoria salina IIICB1]NET86975.1 beta-ketoacyl-ACP synthase III [Kamptonema sp. SIO1D9]
MQTRSVKIVATGKYLPKNKVTATQLAAKLGIDAAWIEKKSGVQVRYFVEDESASEMGAYAAKSALEAAGLSFFDIDCLICTSSTPEQAIPCTAALVQKRLGGENSGIPAFDLNSTCLSFVTGLDTIAYAIAAGRYRRVLLVATEVCTGINWEDRETCTLFGDGAAAVIIAQTEEDETGKIICSRLETYSRGANLCECKAGGNKYHPQDYSKNLSQFLFTMNGKAVFRFACEILPDFLDRLFQPAGLEISDLDMVIPHQASLMAMKLIRKQLGIPKEKWLAIAHNHGNTIAASIPMALHEAIVQEKIQRGSLIMLLGTSAGFSVGAIVMQY